MADRLKTGVVQCGDDWPGVFIRGDKALMGYAPALANILSGRKIPLDYAQCAGLLKLLRSCKAGKSEPQMVALSPPPKEGETP